MDLFSSLPLPARGTVLTSEQAMRLAISEAYKGAAGASPNPLVGSVVLDAQGGFLSAGYHAKYGGPHAEVNALKNLSSEELQGAHVFVTLEPCAHEGKTPSCAKMIAKLPVRKVTYGLVDPNPLVAGQGAEILKQAGIEAELFTARDPEENKNFQVMLEEVCEAFLFNYRQKKIFVALKMASSLDGQVALRNGESQWITGPDSREKVHYLRACYDGVLVGRGTVDFDNPSLNIRHPQITKENKVIVIDAEAGLLPKYRGLKLSQVHPKENIFWCVAEEKREQVEKLRQGNDNLPQFCFVKTRVSGELDLSDLLQELWNKGLRSVMVEGGAMTASSFVSCGLVNRLYLFQAPIIMGSGGSRSWTESIRIQSMKDKLQLKNPRFLTCGNDFMVTGSF